MSKNVESKKRSVEQQPTQPLLNRLPNDTNIPFMVLMVYNPDSIDKNKLLYAIAKYNFTGFPVRSFDIDTQSSPNGEEMQIGGFNNFDEALLYARKIRQQRDIIRLLSKAHIYVISNKKC